MNSETKTCQNCKTDFTIEPEDFAFYEKMQVPPPTWCPQCRMMRRFIWRNEHTLFRRKDARDGKDIFSGIPPQSPVQVYENSYWWSDAFDASVYAREYDFSRPFFEQFRELLYAVPWTAKSILRMINSDYNDQASDFKNCYLCFNGHANEDCAYTTNASFDKDCFDISMSMNNQLCYDSVTVNKSYNVYFSVDIESSTNICLSKNLVGCNDCVGCVNLRKKSYNIFNQQYSKEKYLEKLKELHLDTYSGLEAVKKTAHDYWLQFPVKFMLGVRNFGSSGDRLFDTKMAEGCYRVSNAENVKYCQDLYKVKSTDCYDYATWGGASRMYESLTCGEQVDMIRFCFDCWPSSSYLDYCSQCHSSSNLFGCVGLKKKQYCILNKQYTKEEYEALVPKIIAHMNEMPYTDTRGRIYKYGEFFPIEFSPFAYNETLLNDYFPLTESEAVAQGFVWRESENRLFETTMDAKDLPGSIHDATDTVLKENIKCATCAKAYKIIPKEFEFLKAAGIPLPRTCFQCRLKHRQAFVNPPVFYKRKCMKANCQNEFETAYAPNSPEIVYCESCYQQEVL